MQSAGIILRWWQGLNLTALLTTYDPSTLSTISQRRADLKSIISYNLKNAPRDLDMPIGVWATDGSHVAELAPIGKSSTTSSLVGRTTTTYSITGQATTSAHGELLALVVALHVISRERPLQPTILSDYMNGINAVAKARDPVFRVTQWAGRPLSELYTWLGMLVKSERRVNATVQHVKVHTLAADRDSQLNKAADAAAKSAHHPELKDNFRTLPPLTAYMKSYVVHDHSLGYVPDNWSAILDKRLAKIQFAELPPQVQARLTVSTTQPNTAVRPYFYSRSPSKFVIRVQYLLRAGHIANDYVNWKKGKKSTPGCSLCADTFGSLVHLFRYCSAMRQPREKAIEDAVKDYRPYRKDGVKEVDEDVVVKLKQAYRRYITKLLNNDDSPEFWYGLMGMPPKPLAPGDAGQAHDFAIKLTAHIYGKWISVQGSIKPPEPRVGSSLGRGLGEPEDGTGEGEEEEEEEESDEYLTDIADSDIDDDQYFEEYHQNMHLAGDDKYSSDQEQDQVVVDRPVICQEKRAWIPHGGRRQRSTQDEEGLESTQGSRKEASQDNRDIRDTRDNRDGVGSSQDQHGKRKRAGGDMDGRRSKSGRMDMEADMDIEVER
jgi:ribonuclease HI